MGWREAGGRWGDEEFRLGQATSQVSSGMGRGLGNQRCSLAVVFKELAGLGSLRFSQFLQTPRLMLLSKMSGIDISISRSPYVRMSEGDPRRSTLFLTGGLKTLGVKNGHTWPRELSAGGGWGASSPAGLLMTSPQIS